MRAMVAETGRQPARASVSKYNRLPELHVGAARRLLGVIVDQV